MPVYNAWSSDRKAKGKTINCAETQQTLNEDLSEANYWVLCVKFVHLCVKGKTGPYCCTQGICQNSSAPYAQGDLMRYEWAFGQIPQGEAAD